MISVLILTKNEEVNLARCLESVAWSDDIVVLDSGSTDRTVEIAKAHGARVFFREWDGELEQRTHSLQLPFQYAWVYNPDADEVAEPELAREMLGIARGEGDCAMYRVRRRDMFMGRWLRRSSLYPTWVVRFYQPGRIRFRRSINLACEVDGKEGRLEGHMVHYSFSKGLAAWVEKHNYYSTMEARDTRRERGEAVEWAALASGDGVKRRAALKGLAQRSPARWMLRFLYMYFWRLGLLDGVPGFYYCLLISYYELLIELKVAEAEAGEI